MWDKHKGKLPLFFPSCLPLLHSVSGYSPYLCTPPCRVGAHTLFTCIVLTLYYSRRGKWNLAVPSHSSANLWRINKPLPHVEDKLVIDLHWNHFVEPALLHGRPRIVERRFSNKDSKPFVEQPVVKKSSKPVPRGQNATNGVRKFS